jgi:CHAD domain-containing protein
VDPLSNRRPLTEELAAVATRRVAEARPIIMLDDPHEAVHEARRTAKELRGLLRLVRPAIGPIFTRLNAHLRDGARRLSESRDAAAIIESIDEHLAPQARGPVERTAVGVMRRRVLAQRQALDATWLRRTALELLEEMEAIPDILRGLQLDRPEADAIAAGVTRSYRRGLRAMRRALKDDDPAIWHEWRKRAKYHRYHTELLLDTDPDVMREHRKACKDLADALGADHDLVVLEAFVDTPGGPLGPVGRGVLRRLIRRQRARLRRKAAQIGPTVFGLPAAQVFRETRSRWSTYRPADGGTGP